MNEKISDEIKQAHDRVADSYGLAPVEGSINPESYAGWNFQTHVIEPLGRIVAQHWKGAHILDAGCGNGQIAEALLNLGVGRITGIDFSENMLKNAEKRFQKYNDKHKFIPLKADIDNLSTFKPESFDGAILFGVLEHLDNPGKVIKNIFTSLKPGSVFVVGVPRKGSLSHLTYTLFGESPNRWGRNSRLKDKLRFAEKNRFYRFFTLSEMKQIISEIPGAIILEQIPFAFGHMDGIPGYPLRLAGKNINIGHMLLRFWGKTCRFIGLIPAGEFWLISKSKIEQL